MGINLLGAGHIDTSKTEIISLDLLFEAQDWDTYQGVKFHAEAPTGIETVATLTITNAYADKVDKKIRIRDGLNEYYTPAISDNTWYNVKIELNATNNNANISVTQKSDSVVIYEVTETIFNPGSFSYMGIGYYDQPNYGDSWSPISVDNVNISGIEG